MADLNVQARVAQSNALDPNEIAAGIVRRDIADFSKPPGYVARYVNGQPTFDPATGQGTDNRLAIQMACDYACAAHGIVWFEPGRYYTGPDTHAYDAIKNPGRAQIMLGVGGEARSARNVSVVGNGAEVYQGTAGKMLCVYEADNVQITGLRLFGYAGGATGPARENDTPLSISNRSQGVRIERCYLTNSLGDALAIYGDLANRASRHCRNITIAYCVLKQRHGNGVASVSGGTQSRLALAVINVVGLDVHDCLIYGYIDLEPNDNAEHIVDVDIHGNHFRSGHVTAQPHTGVSYWHDEPVALSGGVVLRQGVVLTSIGSPITGNVRVRDNTFEQGRIECTGDPNRMDVISGNVFTAGQILLGPWPCSRVRILNNKAHAPIPGQSAFIKLTGPLSDSVITGNSALDSKEWKFCVAAEGGKDGGGNVFSANECTECSVLGFNPATSSILTREPR